MPKVSVVIPVYNTEALLDRTLTSVTRQTLSDIEIICIDDGSKDNSLTILQSWQARDSRIRVIALPENGGVSRARNIGIDKAVSPYIYFLDSDDWIDDDYLEAMFLKADKTGQDVVVNGSIFIEHENETKALNLNWEIKEEGFYPTSVIQSHLVSTCTRLYKREFLIRNGIRFPDIDNGEDIYFSGLAEVLQEQSYVFFGPYFHYWQRAGSLSHLKNNVFKYILNCRLLYRELVARGIALDGLRLIHFWVASIDSQEDFNLIRDYLLEAGPAILEHRDRYTVLDNQFFDVILSCPDYDTFLANHNPNIAVDYLRRRLKNGQRDA